MNPPTPMECLALAACFVLGLLGALVALVWVEFWPYGKRKGSAPTPPTKPPTD